MRLRQAVVKDCLRDVLDCRADVGVLVHVDRVQQRRAVDGFFLSAGLMVVDPKTIGRGAFSFIAFPVEASGNQPTEFSHVPRLLV